MSKTTKKHPLEAVFAELGKDVGAISRTLMGIEQTLSQKPTSPEAESAVASTTGDISVLDLKEALECIKLYQGYAKAATEVKESFERFLKPDPMDYELTEEQRQRLYHTMCQHVWLVHRKENASYETAEIPIPAEFQGKFGYIVYTTNSTTLITHTLLGEVHHIENMAFRYDHNLGEHLPRLVYLVIPDLVAMREPQVV